MWTHSASWVAKRHLYTVRKELKKSCANFKTVALIRFRHGWCTISVRRNLTSKKTIRRYQFHQLHTIYTVDSFVLDRTIEKKSLEGFNNTLEYIAERLNWHLADARWKLEKYPKILRRPSSKVRFYLMCHWTMICKINGFFLLIRLRPN